MKWFRCRKVGCGRVTPIGGVVLALSMGCTTPGATEPIALVEPHGGITVYESSVDAPPANKGNFSEQFLANGLTFNITYEDMGVGFTDPTSGPAVRSRFKDVLAYVAETINISNRSLDIQVRPSEFDGTGALASAGTFFPLAPGIHPGSTLQRLNSGIKPFVGFPEIAVTVDVGFAWNISEGDPAPGTADFFSVLLHEITHGLGVTSLIQPDGSSSVSAGVYSTYDSLLTDGMNAGHLVSGGTPPTFQANTASLTGDDVWFDGTEAFDRYGTGTPVPVYAPGPFEPGSSISHWDLNVLQGTAVMTHAITLGTAQRDYAPVDVGALIDLGYNRIDGAPAAPPPGCNPIAAKGGTARVAGGDGILLVLTGALLVGRRKNR